MAEFWNVDWSSRTGMFAPLDTIAKGLPDIGWPNVELLNEMADNCDHRIVNARGQRIRFVEQLSKATRFEDGFEPRAYLTGEVMVRPFCWHDLFNALVWMSFPTAKAAINASHFTALSSQTDRRRTASGDALTMFDEDGLVVLSSNAELLDLLRSFRWKELFWEHRELVRKQVRFVVFGHAMYEKARAPFVGLTGKALLFTVPAETVSLQGTELNGAVDQLVGLQVHDGTTLTHGQSLSPLPVLGVPGWWPDNENGSFYNNTRYFRRGRRIRTATRSSER